jgi:hypothetical protein
MEELYCWQRRNQGWFMFYDGIPVTYNKMLIGATWRR